MEKANKPSRHTHSKCSIWTPMSLDLDFNSDDDMDLPLENKAANPKTSNAASKFAQFMKKPETTSVSTQNSKSKVDTSLALNFDDDYSLSLSSDTELDLPLSSFKPKTAVVAKPQVQTAPALPPRTSPTIKASAASKAASAFNLSPKAVTALAPAPAPAPVAESTTVLLSSELMKKSPKGMLGYHPWQQRFFTLYADRIVYRRNEDSDEDLGVIPLVSITDHYQLDDRSYFNVVCGTVRTFELQADSLTLASAWVSQLNKLRKAERLRQMQLHGDEPVPLSDAQMPRSASFSDLLETEKFWKLSSNAQSQPPAPQPPTPQSVAPQPPVPTPAAVAPVVAAPISATSSAETLPPSSAIERAKSILPSTTAPLPAEPSDAFLPLLASMQKMMAESSQKNLLAKQMAAAMTAKLMSQSVPPTPTAAASSQVSEPAVVEPAPVASVAQVIDSVGVKSETPAAKTDSAVSTSVAPATDVADAQPVANVANGEALAPLDDLSLQFSADELMSYELHPTQDLADESVEGEFDGEFNEQDYHDFDIDLDESDLTPEEIAHRRRLLRRLQREEQVRNEQASTFRFRPQTLTKYRMRKARGSFLDEVARDLHKRAHRSLDAAQRLEIEQQTLFKPHLVPALPAVAAQFSAAFHESFSPQRQLRSGSEFPSRVTVGPGASNVFNRLYATHVERQQREASPELVASPTPTAKQSTAGAHALYQDALDRRVRMQEVLQKREAHEAELRSGRKISHNSLQYARKNVERQLNKAFAAVVEEQKKHNEGQSVSANNETLDADAVQDVLRRMGFFSPFLRTDQLHSSRDSVTSGDAPPVNDRKAMARERAELADQALQRRILQLLDSSIDGRVDKAALAQFLDLLVCRLAVPRTNPSHNEAEGMTLTLGSPKAGAASDASAGESATVGSPSASQPVVLVLSKDNDQDELSATEAADLKAQLDRLAINSLSYGPQLKRMEFEQRERAKREQTLRQQRVPTKRTKKQTAPLVPQAPPHEVLLIDYGINFEAKMRAERLAREADLLKECTFQPQISQKSKSIAVNSDTRPGSHFEQLYADQRARSERLAAAKVAAENARQAAEMAECRFKPAIRNAPPSDFAPSEKRAAERAAREAQRAKEQSIAAKAIADKKAAAKVAQAALYAPPSVANNMPPPVSGSSHAVPPSPRSLSAVADAASRSSPKSKLTLAARKKAEAEAEAEAEAKRVEAARAERVAAARLAHLSQAQPKSGSLAPPPRPVPVVEQLTVNPLAIIDTPPAVVVVEQPIAHVAPLSSVPQMHNGVQRLSALGIAATPLVPIIETSGSDAMLVPTSPSPAAGQRNSQPLLASSSDPTMHMAPLAAPRPRRRIRIGNHDSDGDSSDEGGNSPSASISSNSNPSSPVRDASDVYSFMSRSPELKLDQSEQPTESNVVIQSSVATESIVAVESNVVIESATEQSNVPQPAAEQSEAQMPESVPEPLPSQPLPVEPAVVEPVAVNSEPVPVQEQTVVPPEPIVEPTLSATPSMISHQESAPVSTVSSVSQLPSEYSVTDDVFEATSQPDRVKLLVMQVQVSKTVSDQIEFYEGDEVDEVVRAFGEVHNLTASKQGKLAVMLRAQVDAAIQQRQSAAAAAAAEPEEY